MHRATEEKLQLIAIQIKVSTVNFFTYIYQQLETKFNNKRADLLPPTFNKLGRPNLLWDDLLQKIKEVVIRVRLSEALISRNMERSYKMYRWKKANM